MSLVESIGSLYLVVCPNVQHHREDTVGCDAAHSAVECELANANTCTQHQHRDQHATPTQVDRAENVNQTVKAVKATKSNCLSQANKLQNFVVGGYEYTFDMPVLCCGKSEAASRLCAASKQLCSNTHTYPFR